MSGYITFDARVEPLVWGRATYTIIRLPEAVTLALGAARRVEGEIAEHPVNLAPTRAPVLEGQFLWAGKSLLDRIGVVPGDVVELRLRPAPDDRVDVPPDVEAALRARGLADVWAVLTPGKRRGLLYQVETAKTDATRARRIDRLMQGLGE